MAGCGPCPDSCNCQIADENGVIYPGSGDAGSPIIVPRAVPETTFVGTSTGGTITITPSGTAGHNPNFEVNVCAILDEAAERQNGRIVIFSDDVDCKPERLRNPLIDEYLGFDPISGQATWLPLPTDFSLTIDPDSTAPVSYGPAGLRVDCCPLPDPELLVFEADDTFDPSLYADLAGVWAEVVGGGGGSGGTTTGVGESSSTGGGGGGGYSKRFIPFASLLALETITVGVGGAAGVAASGTGGTGGTSSFGAHLSATGGEGGVGHSGTTGTQAANGGAGGVGVGGELNVAGEYGGTGVVAGGDRVPSGNGGGSFYGGGPRGAAGGPLPPAANAYGAGAGGGGFQASANSQAGETGADGVVILTPVYYNT